MISDKYKKRSEVPRRLARKNVKAKMPPNKAAAAPPEDVNPFPGPSKKTYDRVLLWMTDGKTIVQTNVPTSPIMEVGI